MSTQDNKKLFNDFLNEARKRELYNSQAYDKAVLTLSSVSLGYSLTLIKLEDPTCFALMVIAWVLLVITITGSLISFLFANKGIKEAIKNAEDYYLKDKEDALNKDNYCDNIADSLNSVVGVLLIIAIIMIIVFVVLNK